MLKQKVSAAKGLMIVLIFVVDSDFKIDLINFDMFG